MVPAKSSVATDGSSSFDQESSKTPQAERRAAFIWTQIGTLFAGMSRSRRRIMALVAVVGVLSAVSPVTALFGPAGEAVSDAATPWAMVLAPSSVILLLVMVYGQATSCPSCGKWWARSVYDSSFVGREVFERGGESFARATYRTTYACSSCRRQWSVDHSDEYKDFIGQESPKKRVRSI